MRALGQDRRAPRIIVLENVCGALTSHGGKDFAAIGAALARGGYRFGAIVVDAAKFLPQSRPRLFIVAVLNPQSIPPGLVADTPDPEWHSAALIAAYRQLSKQSREAWLWWRLPTAPARNATFADLIEQDPKGVVWHSEAQTRRLLSMMTQLNAAKVEAAKKSGRRTIGGVYKRTRLDEAGNKIQRAEVRFDDVAGCLRTPAGGSSRADNDRKMTMELAKGITRNGEGFAGVRWNILGQSYFPKAVCDSAFAFETNSDPGQFVPVHIRPTQDEFILVQEGELSLKLDGVCSVAKAGDLVRMPRGIPHGYFNKSDEPARALFWVSPAGRLEDLLRALDGLTDVPEVLRLSALHDVDFLPPEASA